MTPEQHIEFLGSMPEPEPEEVCERSEQARFEHWEQEQEIRWDAWPARKIARAALTQPVGDERSESREKFISYWDSQMSDAMADGHEDKSVGWPAQYRFDKVAAEIYDAEIAPLLAEQPQSAWVAPEAPPASARGQ